MAEKKKTKKKKEVVEELPVENYEIDADPATDEEANPTVEQLKTIFQSTTVWGIILSVISKLLILVFGVEIGENASAELINMAALYTPLVIGFVGDAISLRGRMKAKKTLVFKKKKRE